MRCLLGATVAPIMQGVRSAAVVFPSLTIAGEVLSSDPLIGASRPSPGGASTFSVEFATEFIT